MDKEELDKWLKDKPREVAVAIASRAALRVAVNLPMDWIEGEIVLRDLTFSSLRCLIKSLLGARSITDELNLLVVSAALSEAASAANSAANSVLSAFADNDAPALSAINTAALSAADSENFDIWHEVEWDMEYLEQSDDLRAQASKLVEQRLFNVAGNDWSNADFMQLERLAQQVGFAWWVEWLRAMHDGTFRDWDLAERIVTEIPEKIWEQGAVAVAEEIERLQEMNESAIISDENGNPIVTEDNQAIKVDNPASSAEFSLAAGSRDVKVRNQQAVILTTQGLEAMIVDLREQMGGLHNQISKEDYDRIVSSLDQMISTLMEFRESLASEEDYDIEENIGWWTKYKSSLKVLLGIYCDAENVAKVTVPTGIVVGSATLGSLVGQPIIGAVVGGAIVQQVNSTQLTREMIKQLQSDETEH